MAIAIVIGFSGSGEASIKQLAADTSPVFSQAPQCKHAHRGLAFYVRRHGEWRDKMGVGDMNAEQTRTRASRGHVSCPLYLANVWKQRSWVARQQYEAWLVTRTLRDVPFGDGNRAWLRAVREVQRVFPGTESWLLSCSAAEGGHGRWVGYSGVGYSAWLRDSDTVGGPLQFRFSTFTGMFRRGADHARAEGFRIPAHLRDQTTAWRSALGQAIAGGWARYTGNDNSHWIASWANGCR